MDERSRGIKKLVIDGLGEFVARDLYLSAGKTKSKCIKVVSLIYCMFNFTKVLIVEPNLESRVRRMQDVTAAMKTKEQPLPLDIVAKFKEMYAPTWKPMAPTTSPSEEEVAKGAGSSSGSSALPADNGTAPEQMGQGPPKRRR